MPRGSNRRRAIKKARSLLWIFCFLFSSRLMTGLDPHLRISQYGHTAWRVPEGLLAHPSAITQTADGYIWIATHSGIFRFDGVKFTEWKPPDNQHLPSRSVQYLLGGRDGSLWFGTPDGLSRFKAGRLTNYVTDSRFDEAGIGGILEDHTGKIWVSRYRIRDNEGPLCWAKETTLECYGEKEGLPAAYGLSLAEDNTGNLWFGCQRLCRWEHGSSTTYFNEQLKNPAGEGVEDVAAAASGDVWAAMEGRGPKAGVQHFSNGRWTSFILPGFDGAQFENAGLFVDKRQTLWIGSASDGLYHAHDGFADHFGTADGLTGDNIDALYEDWEGNLWVGTDQGLDMFRDKAVTTFSKSQSLSAGIVRAVAAVDGDSVWVGGEGGLDVIRSGLYSSIRRQAVPGHDVTSLFADSIGQVWLGIDGRIFICKDGRYVEAQKADGSALGRIGDVTAFAEDRDGDIWALSTSPIEGSHDYLLVIRNRRVRQKIVPNSPDISFLAGDRHAGIWALDSDGELLHYVNDRVTESTRLDKVVDTYGFDVDSYGAIWAWTNTGLYRWSNGRATLMNPRNGSPCARPAALIEDDRGSHWLRGPCGIFRITSDEWQRWLTHPESDLPFTLFGPLDGAQSGSSQNQQAVAKTRDGKIWFVGGPGVQMVDPGQPPNSPPPPVHIEEVIADHKTYESQDKVAVPRLRGELEINYTALSFKIPQRVHFRYKLEGHDDDWQDVGTRRQAFYNDLPPRKYRFRVIACNSDGVWNEVGASLDFSILPAWYQTASFRALCAAAFVLLLWAAYLLRVRQLRHEFNIRLEAQVSERTRIARELHDTMLQSFQGLLLRFQTVLNLLPARPEEAMTRIEGVIEEGSNAITEGRDAVHELRTMGLVTVDLGQSIKDFAKELLGNLSSGNHPELGIQVEGTAKELDPVVRDEVYRLAAEALRNAIRHSGAKRIEVEIRYGLEELQLRVRDDGKGIDASVLDKEHAPGHWGLSGMRERARLIGASFEIWSKSGSGTEIELKIPAAGAYAKSLGSRGSFFSRGSWS